MELTEGYKEISLARSISVKEVDVYEYLRTLGTNFSMRLANNE